MGVVFGLQRATRVWHKAERQDGKASNSVCVLVGVYERGSKGESICLSIFPKPLACVILK